jgi:hypothetical protein
MWRLYTLAESVLRLLTWLVIVVVAAPVLVVALVCALVVALVAIPCLVPVVLWWQMWRGLRAIPV